MGNGTDSELRRPLGLVIIGSLMFSQVLTLFTTPVVYLMFDRLSQRFTGNWMWRSTTPFEAPTLP